MRGFVSPSVDWLVCPPVGPSVIRVWTQKNVKFSIKRKTRLDIQLPKLHAGGQGHILGH